MESILFLQPGMENKEKDFKFNSLKITPGNKMLGKFEEDLFKLVFKKSNLDLLMMNKKKILVYINNAK